MEEDPPTSAVERAPGRTPLTTPARLAILSCLMVFLYFPGLCFYLLLTRSSLDGPFGSLAAPLWLVSIAALLFLCAKQAKAEPTLIRECLTAMALVVVLFVLLALSLPAVT